MAATRTEHIVRKLPADRIVPGDNDRKTFDQHALEVLARSIAENGLAQPIIVRPAGEQFEIVAGERRFRAMTRYLGWDRIPSLVRDYDDAHAANVMLAENTSRADLDPIEEGGAYAKQLDLGRTIDEIADIAGVPVSRVRARLRTLDGLCENAKDDYRAGILNHQQALELCSIDKDRQQPLLDAMRRESFSTSQWRDLLTRIRRAQAEDAESGLFNADEFTLRVEEFTADVKRKRPFNRTAARSLIRRLAAELGDDHPLAVEAAEFIASELP